MAETPVSRTYAQALIELCDTHGVLDQVTDEFAAFVEAWKAKEGLRLFLSSPSVGRDRKVALVSEAGAKFSDVFRKFLGVLAQRGRIVVLEEIHESFVRILEDRGGLLRARATFATCMEESRVAELEKELADKLGKKVSLWVEQDPRILGGMVLQIGDRRVDMSLRRRLSEFRESMAAG